MVPLRQSHSALRFIDDPPHLPRQRLARPRLPGPARFFFALVLIVCGTVTLPQVVGVGGTSGLGLWTLLVALVSWLLWIAKPYFPRDLVWPLLPLLMFCIYVIASALWSGTADPAVQNLAVLIAFVGLILLSARECERDLSMAHTIHRAFDAASIIAGIAYSIVLLRDGRGGEMYLGTRPVFLARPFALFAMLCVGRQVARWLAGDRRGLWMAIWLTALVFASDSRLATVACLMLFPLAFLLRGDRRSIAYAVLMAVMAASAFAATLMYSQEFYDRFFKYDASLSVGGVAINGSGRLKMWDTVLDDLQGEYFFGKGVASASRLIEIHFPGLGHPHNDFLRYLYEFGVLGLSLYLLFLFGTAGLLLRRIPRMARTHDPELALFMTPLLMLAGLSAAMATDNPVIYAYVMLPVGVLVGCGLGRIRARRLASRAADAPLPSVAWNFPPSFEKESDEVVTPPLSPADPATAPPRELE